MRSIRHLTPRYVWHRARFAAYRRANPGTPWMAKEVAVMLDSLLRPSDFAVEFGSGSSTSWLGRRVASLISIESDPTWFERVKVSVGAMQSVELRPTSAATSEEYLRAVAEVGQVDVVLDDGCHRGEVALWAIDHLQSGGILIVDDTNWFLPFAPHATCSDYAETPDFEAVVARTDGWRKLWATTGYTDTTIWIKP